MTEHPPHYETPNEPADHELSSAELCRRKGWKVGDVLVGIDRDCCDETVEIRLTAIGECEILAVQLSMNGEVGEWDECEWGLHDRVWRQRED